MVGSLSFVWQKDGGEEEGWLAGWLMGIVSCLLSLHAVDGIW